MTEFFAHCVEPSASISPMTAILVHELKHIGTGASGVSGSRLISSAHEFFEGDDGKLVVGAGKLMGRDDLENLLR